MNTQNEINERFDRLEKLLLFQKKILTVPELSIYTGYKPSYIYRLTAARKLPFSKPIGGQIFFDREEIEEFLRQNPIPMEQHLNKKIDNLRLK